LDYDDIIIGSGLSALGAVIGLPSRRRVLVVGGRQQGTFIRYGLSTNIPCAYSGFGGLGRFWHGVIPTGLRKNFASSTPESFARFFGRFYPRTNIETRLGEPWLFVPWKPIRPRVEWRRLCVERSECLVLSDAIANRFECSDAGVSVYTDKGKLTARRVWLAAGALHTPDLVDRSLGIQVSRRFVSDHAICYLGQVRRDELNTDLSLKIERTVDGVFFRAQYDDASEVLTTLKPARFRFKELDYGIELRTAFGLPTAHAVIKIARSMSLGMLAEALYNRTGLFSIAKLYNVYAQIVVRDAYELKDSSNPPSLRPGALHSAISNARASPCISQLMPSRLPNAYLPGIHLHHSLNLSAIMDNGINTESGPVQVIDTSIYDDIGCDHHSFKVMIAANERAMRLN
jgi:hypothetical protein